MYLHVPLHLVNQGIVGVRILLIENLFLFFNNIYFFANYCFCFTHSKCSYNENEILTKVEELRRILSEKEGITSKEKKEGRSKYVQIASHFNFGVN